MAWRITNAAMTLLLLTPLTTTAFIQPQQSPWIGNTKRAPELNRINDIKFCSLKTRRQQNNASLQMTNNDIEDESSSSDHNSEETANQKKEDLTKETEKLTKNVKRRLLQAELDSILNSPDPPFDYEGAIDSVQGGISTPLPPNSCEALMEEKVHEMETSLYNSIKDKNWEKATKQQQEISKLHVDDCGYVLQTNSLFYKAFSKKDYDAMEALWLKDPSVKCIHPCQTPLVGAKDVLNSWKALFASANPQFQKNKMVPTNIHLSLKGTTAIVTCDEEISTKRFVRGKKRKEEVVNKLTATNIFRKMGDKWYMVHHHSSWHADTDVAKNALNYQSGGSSSSIVRKKLGSGGGEEGSDLSLDDILGIPQNDLGGSKKGITGGEEGPQVKRVFMGSLSDLLNGGLSDILSDDDLGGSSSSSGSSLGDILRSSGSSSSLNGNGGIKPTIIRLNGQIGDSDDDIVDIDEEDDDEDDDDEDEDDEHDDEDAKKEGATRDALKVIKDMSKISSSSSSGSGNNKVVVLGQQQEQEEQEPLSKNNVPKDALRQNCITALRKLCDQGAISPKQKRVLLTDIITCSARGEFSMVEVAFELLCGEESYGGSGEDRDIGEEEFADQCRVFAMSLPEFPTP